MNQDVSQFVAAVSRVPLFNGLQPTQAISLLKVCERRTLDKGETLCRFGDRSDQMYILLSGAPSVCTEDGVQIARIDPIAPVGEMGIFTEEPRSATVVAAEASSLFVLGKFQLQGAMRRNSEMEIIVSRNVIATLAQRLRDANQEVAHLRDLIADQESGRDTPPESMEDTE